MRTYLFEFTDVNKAIFISVKDLERFPKVGFHVIGPVSDDDEDDEDEDEDDNEESVQRSWMHP